MLANDRPTSTRTNLCTKFKHNELWESFGFDFTRSPDYKGNLPKNSEPLVYVASNSVEESDDHNNTVSYWR